MNRMDLQAKWHREVEKAKTRYAKGMERALAGPVPVWESAIHRHEQAIKRLRKMIRNANSKRRK